MKGYIHSFESLAALDGAGVRYGVFLAGCPLRCVCCHNPDTWEKSGMIYQSDELVKKISRYKPYFGNDGGVTFSGGEPMLQAEFIKSMLPALAENEINYVIDTSGTVALCEDVKEVYENAEEVLLDLKFWDEESYREYAKADMKKVLDTLDFLEDIKKDTRIRTVVIPGINDNEEMISKYVSIIKNYTCVKKYELLAFHTMGFFKYEKLGIENPLLNTPPLDKERLVQLQKYADSNLQYLM